MFNITMKRWGIGANIDSNSKFETPLHISCSSGNLQIVQYLIEEGANFEAKDNDEISLHFACENGHLPIVQDI